MKKMFESTLGIVTFVVSVSMFLIALIMYAGHLHAKNQTYTEWYNKQVSSIQKEADILYDQYNQATDLYEGLRGDIKYIERKLQEQIRTGGKFIEDYTELKEQAEDIQLEAFMIMLTIEYQFEDLGFRGDVETILDR